MLQLRQLNLKLAFARPGALREDVENQRRAIEHFALENPFQVAALRGRKFVVEDDCIDILVPAMPAKFIGLAAADESSGGRRFELLRALADDFGPGRHGEFRQFIQRIAHLPARATFQFGPNEENPFGSRVRCRYERFQLLNSQRQNHSTICALLKSNFFAAPGQLSGHCLAVGLRP